MSDKPILSWTDADRLQWTVASQQTLREYLSVFVLDYLVWAR